MSSNVLTYIIELQSHFNRLQIEFKDFFDKYTPTIVGKTAVSFFKSRFQIEGWERAGDWQQVQRTAYVLSSLWDSLDSDRGQCLLTVDCCLLTLKLCFYPQLLRSSIPKHPSYTIPRTSSAPPAFLQRRHCRLCHRLQDLSL